MSSKPILLTARARLIQPNYRIVKSQFDLDYGREFFGEYAMFNLLRERGDIYDGEQYLITIKHMKR